MTPFRIALREIRHRPIHAFLFMLTLAVGGSAVLSVEAISGGLKKYAFENARELNGGDIAVEADSATLGEIEASCRSCETAKTLETLTMITSVDSRVAARVSLKAVSGTYPLTGSVILGGGSDLVLGPREIAIAPRLLDDLGLRHGDSVMIGRAPFTIKNTIKSRSDAAFSFFEISPIVFMRLEDLDVTGLITEGSRARERMTITLPAVDVTKQADFIRNRFEGRGQITVAGASESGGFRSLQNTLTFLRALGVMTLLVACITIATTVAGAIGDALPSLSALRAIGASDRYVIRIWLWWSVLLGIAGVTGAVLLSQFLADVLFEHYRGVLTTNGDISTSVEWRTIGTVFIVALLSALWPLRQLVKIPPAALLRPGFDLSMKGTITAILLLAAVLPFGVAWRVDALTAFQSLATLVATGAFVFLARGILFLFRRWAERRGELEFRLAAAGWRSGGLRGAAYLSSGLAFTMILSTLLLEANLHDHFIKSYPSDAPNVIFANIRPDQITLVRETAGNLSDIFPLIRGRVVSVNGRPAAEIESEARASNPRVLGGGDRLTREFGFTYGEKVPVTDQLVEGGALFDDGAGAQVSIHSGFSTRYGIHAGDRIVVNVMGRTFDARVSSVREIDRSARRPFFYFIFQPGLLEQAPHTFMASAKLDTASTSALERRLAAEAPNVTVFDIRDAVAAADLLLGRLGSAARMIGWLTAFCGALFLVASVLVEIPRLTRTSSILRALGADRRQVAILAATEQSIGAVGTMVVAVLVAEALVGILLHYGMELSLLPQYRLMGMIALGGIFSMMAITLIALRPSWKAPPWEALRYE